MQKIIAFAAAFCGLTAFAATPVAVWEGDFTTNTTQNDHTLGLGGCEVVEGGVKIVSAPFAITNTTITTDNKTSYDHTIIMDVELPESLTGTLLTFGRWGTNANYFDSDLIGLYLDEGETWGWWDKDKFATTPVKQSTLTAGAHRLVYRYLSGGRTARAQQLYVDGELAYTAPNGLRATIGARTISVGGVSADNSNLLTGLIIKKFALFIETSAQADADYLNYKFPSQTTTLTYPENVAMSKILADMGASLKADVTIADGKTISVDVLPAEKDVNFSCADGTITLDVADGLAYAAEELDCAAVVKTGSGAITFTRNGTYTNCTITAGSATTSAPAGYGAYTGGAEMGALSIITVGEGATLDVGGSRDYCYTIVSDGGTITNAGNDTSTENRQTTKLVLNAPTTVTGNTWGIRATGGKRAAIETNGYSLTIRMNEGKSFLIHDCTVTGGGTLSVVAGALVPSGSDTIDLTSTEKRSGLVMIAWAEDVEMPSLDAVTITGLGDFPWGIDADAREIKILDTVAEMNGKLYPSVAAAVEEAAENAVIKIRANCGGAVTLNKAITLTCADGVKFRGTLTGTGSITIPAGEVLTYVGSSAIGPTVLGEGTLLITEVESATLPAVAGLTAETWTGTVWLKGMTGKTNINLANLGNAASTIKISGLHGWMANAQTITANVHLANEGYQYGFNINNGGSGVQNVSTFNKLSGDGKLLANGGSTAGFLITDAADFTGPIEATNKTITFGTTKRADLNQIFVEAGVVVTNVASWTANGGIKVEGTVVVPGTTTYNNYTPQAETHGTMGSKVTGSGEVIYLGALPTDAATAQYTNEDWTGSVTIQDFGILDDRNNNNRNHVRAEFPNKTTVESWQNAGSRITFKGVKAWVTNGLSYDINLCLEDHIGPDGETVYAWHNDSGGSSSTTTFAKLSGTGTFYDNAACQHILKFTDVSDFSGNVRIQGKRLCLGSEAATPAVGGLSVANGATIAVGGQTWTAPGGIALGEEVSVKVAAGVTIPEAGMKVLGWNAKPTGGAFVKDETMPPISSLRVKTDGLYLSLQLPFIFLIK